MAFNEIWENIFQENEWGKYPAEELIRFIAGNFLELTFKKFKLLQSFFLYD